MWDVLCFYTAPVGQMPKMFEIPGINSTERRKKKDNLSSFGVALHFAFQSVFELCIC